MFNENENREQTHFNRFGGETENYTEVRECTTANDYMVVTMNTIVKDAAHIKSGCEGNSSHEVKDKQRNVKVQVEKLQMLLFSTVLYTWCIFDLDVCYIVC